MNYFFYIVYYFLKEKLGKESSNAKWSALLYTSLYFSFTLIILICLLGLLVNNRLSIFYKYHVIDTGLIIFIISSIILFVRFYMNKNILIKTEEKYSELSFTKKYWIKRIVFALFIILPIIFFIVFRLYVIGQVKWW